jgi:hypothetical protein
VSFPCLSSSNVRENETTTGWARLVGCGTTFVAPAHRGISCRLVAVLIVVRRPSSFTRCVDWLSMRRVTGVRLLSPFCALVLANACWWSDKQVIADARRIAGEPEGSEYIPTDARELCGRIMHTCYMGTENSTSETRARAKELAEAIGRFVSRLYLGWST